MIHPTAIIGGVPEHIEWIRDPKLESFAPEVDESVFINSYVTVDAGTWRHTSIGAGSILLTKSHVGHDVIIGENCQLATGAIIGGSCTIGNEVKVGLNAVVVPWRSIGNNVVIGASAVVTKNVPDYAVVAGNPARVIGDSRQTNESFTDRPEDQQEIK